jgi:hypothetical protein
VSSNSKPANVEILDFNMTHNSIVFRLLPNLSRLMPNF